MRTTVDIPDALLDRARERARRDGTTLRQILNEGLRTFLDDARRGPPERFELPKYGSGGLQPGIGERELFDREERDLGQQP